MKSQAATERIVTLTRQRVPARGVLRYRGAWCFEYHIGNEFRGYSRLVDVKTAARKRWPKDRIRFIERWKEQT